MKSMTQSQIPAFSLHERLRGSADTEKFAALLDPFATPTTIAKRLGISRAGYYRLLNDCNLEELKVGVTLLQRVPRSQALATIDAKLFLEERILTYSLARCLGVRLRVCFLPFHEMLTSVAKGVLDFAIASLTNTAERRALVDFTYPYSQAPSPNACLVGNSEALEKRVPRIGVWKGTLFETAVPSFVNSQPTVIRYSVLADCIEGVAKKNVDLTICHSTIAEEIVTKHPHLKILSQPVFFPGRTSIAVAPGREDLLRNLNRGLEYLSDTGHFSRVRTQVFGLSL